MTAGLWSILSRRNALIILLAVWLGTAPGPALGQDNPKPQTETLGQAIAGKAAAFELAIGKGARMGVSVTDLASGQTLASVRPDELFIPASNQKLLVSAFAIHMLGGDYEFTTELYVTRAGDLVVYGDFDPTLGDPELAKEDGKSIYAEMDRWVAVVKEHLGDKPAGRLFVSGGSGVYRPTSWKTNQNHLHYQAPAAKLNFHRNCFSATFRIDQGVPKAIITPQTRFISIVGSVRLGGKQVWSMRPGEARPWSSPNHRAISVRNISWIASWKVLGVSVASFRQIAASSRQRAASPSSSFAMASQPSAVFFTNADMPCMTMRQAS